MYGDLINSLIKNEEWLMERILHYAIELGANRLFLKNLLNAKWPKLIKLFNLFDIFVFKLH